MSKEAPEKADLEKAAWEKAAWEKAAWEKAASLSFWSGPVEPQPLSGGLSNHNFVVEDGGGKFVVRIGDDYPLHGVLRVNEIAASRAAHAAGLSPELVHAEPGALVIRFIDGKTYGPEDVRDPAKLDRILSLVKRIHSEMPRHFRGPPPLFWVFQVFRDYGHTLRQGNSRMLDELPRLLEAGEFLEAAVGAVDIRFTHNDLLAANFIDDGDRIWLVDWEYAGFGSPLFDLSNIASNSELPEEQQRWLLEEYYHEPVTGGLWRRFQAITCASHLREAMWSMVSEIHSAIDFDFTAYTDENLARFERAYEEFRRD